MARRIRLASHYQKRTLVMIKPSVRSKSVPTKPHSRRGILYLSGPPRLLHQKQGASVGFRGNAYPCLGIVEALEVAGMIITQYRMRKRKILSKTTNGKLEVRIVWIV